MDASETPLKHKNALGNRAMKMEKGEEMQEVYILKKDDTSDPVVKVSGHAVHLARLHLGSRDSRGVKK